MSIENRIDGIEERIRADGLRLRPNNGAPLSLPQQTRRPGRPGLELSLLPRQPEPRIQETEKKLRQIMERSGRICVNGVEYQMEMKDLEDLGELGNGTSGHVVKMRHTPTGEIIAVKQMRRTGNDEENQRIVKDLEVVLKSHGCPYIVQCYGFIITSADVWICMELMATCFDNLLKKTNKPIPEDILGKVTVATVKALADLKDKQSVIHRDVKPSNILINEQGIIKLCDFGISGNLNNSKAKTRSAGCAAYMAPERIDPHAGLYDIRADVWSLGITLVEMATGRFPYQGCKTDFEVLTRVLQSDPPRLPTDGVFSQNFQNFVAKCLNKDYKSRPKYPELLQQPFLVHYETHPVNVSAWFSSIMTRAGLTSHLPRSVSPPKLQPPPQSPNLSNEVHRQTPVTATAASPIARTWITTTTQQQMARGVMAAPISEAETVLTKSPIELKQPTDIMTTNYAPISTQSSSLSSADTTASMSNEVLHNRMGTIESMSSSGPLSPRYKSSATNVMPQMALTIGHTTNGTRLMYNPPNMPIYNENRHDYNQMPSVVLLTKRPEDLGRGIERSKSPLPLPPPPSKDTTDIVQEMNKLYKISPFMRRKKEASTGTSPKRESKLSSLGSTLLKNLTTSPFSQKKFGNAQKDTTVGSTPASTTKVTSQLEYPKAAAWTKEREHWYGNSRDGGNGYSDRPPPPEYGRNSPHYYPPSPLLLQRKQQFEQSNSPNAMQAGNTSPIVLQRFYHQQNQIREREEEEAVQQQRLHQYVGGERNTNPFLGANGNEIPLNQIPKYQTIRQQHSHQYDTGPMQIPSCSKQWSDSDDMRQNPAIYAPPSGDDHLLYGNYSPQYHHQYQAAPFQHGPTVSYEQSQLVQPKQSPLLGARSYRSPYNRDSVEDQSANGYNIYGYNTTRQIEHRQPPMSPRMPQANNRLATASNYGQEMAHATDLNVDGRELSSDTVSIPENGKGELGWFNSIAGVVKRRFASYMKLHLQNGGNDSPVHNKNGLKNVATSRGANENGPNERMKFATTNPFLFDNMGDDDNVESENSAREWEGYRRRMESRSIMVQPPKVHGPLSGIDTRHRSPDPPPRYNRGQSPLLLRKNLLELERRTGSPLLPRRFMSSSPPMPPPRRGCESVPSSPQFRTRIHYTPEPMRRFYRPVE